MHDLNTYLFVAAILFSFGVFGVMTRRNGIAILMSVELILNAANINFIAFSRFGGMNLRSEERRVGKECRSRWSPDH